MAVRVSCPFCNAVVPADADDPRVACPRCGESFDSAAADRLPDDTPASIPTPMPQPGFLYSRSAILLSLGVAVAIFGVGMAVVRPWEPSAGPKREARLPVVVSPLGLSGLAYLPAKTNVVAAVQPMPLLAYAVQQKIDPRKLLVEAGVPEVVFTKLSQAGLPLEQVDHLVVGLAVGSEKGQLIPGLTACLRLTKPLADESRFLTQLKAEKNSAQSKGGRTVYNTPAGLPLLLTRVDDVTYLFGLGGEDLGLVDKPMAAGGAHLPKDLRDAMTARLSPASFLFVATDGDRWAEKPAAPAALAAGLLTKEQLATLSSLRAVAGSLSLEPDLELRLAVRTADAPSTADIREIAQKQPHIEAAVFGIDQDWATAQLPFAAGKVSLKSLLGDLASRGP